MQCPNCERRVKRNKNGTIPQHYVEDFPVFGWAQEPCPAVGTTEGRFWARPSASSGSRMRCPACDATVSKKKDGRMRAHLAGDRECKASAANR